MATIEDRAWDWYKRKFMNPSGREQLLDITLRISEESGEVCKAVRQGDGGEVLDEIGDTVLFLTLLANLYGSTLDKCLEKAVVRKERRTGIR